MQVGTHRRTVLASGFGVVSGLGALGFAGGTLAAPKKTLSFPRDHNVHPSFGREAWQLAGYATAGLQDVGFQASFYRAAADG